MKFTAYNYLLGFIVFAILMMFGIMEALQSDFKTALILTGILLPLFFLFKNTYTLANDHLSVGIFNKASRRIWYKDIERIEPSKNIFGQSILKLYYSPRDYLKVSLGKQQDEFLIALKNKCQHLHDS